MCWSVLVDRDLEGWALALAPFVRWSLSRLLTWFRRPVVPLGSRIAGCYLDCERRPATLSDGGITTIISIYCKDRRGISTDPRGEGRPGAESEVCKRFLGCQSDVHQTDWIPPESEGTRVFIAFWGWGAGPWCNDGACASHNYSSTWNSTHARLSTVPCAIRKPLHQTSQQSDQRKELWRTTSARSTVTHSFKKKFCLASLGIISHFKLLLYELFLPIYLLYQYIYCTISHSYKYQPNLFRQF